MKPSLILASENTHPIMRTTHQPLDVFFTPQNVAVIGATEKAGSVGRTVLWNLVSSPFGGTVFPVNLKRPSVLGIKAYPRIADVPAQVDLAVIVAPAPTVPSVIRECAEVGVQGAIIISAGFKERGPEGVELERQVLEQAQRVNMRLIGPNCLGVMNPTAGFNATFASTIARPGHVGFISQSGALCTSILDWSLRENVGFSAFISVGSMLDVGWGDLIDHLGNDPNTRSIIIYMESIGDARSFLSAAREVALTKPIIVIKAGRTEAAARAAASHTGALTGSDEVLDAAFRRCGVLRVNSIANLFAMAEVLAKQPRPAGSRLSILTNAGGPGVLATDTLVLSGGELADLPQETLEKLDDMLPEHWSHANPIDILGDADPERYAKTAELAAENPNSDGLLVILTPQAMTNPTETAKYLVPYAQKTGKPILASWMGGDEVAEGEAILNQAGIPTFPYPDGAAWAFRDMWRYSSNLKSLYETPTLPLESSGEIDHALANQIVQTARTAGRQILTEPESKQLLAAYGIPTVETRTAASVAEAVAHANEIGYPVVLKLWSETITHKTDVGGVQLNLRDAAAVEHAYNTIATTVEERAGMAGENGRAHFMGVTVQPMVSLDGYELIVGSSLDPQFGPVLLFGMGGQLVEVFKDRALGLPPLNTTLARRMIEQTTIFNALRGVRGRASINLESLDQLMVRFSQLVAEQHWIKEIDINPLLASPERLVALDARVVLHPNTIELESLPKLAIRPYPIQYIGSWATNNGTDVTIRPIRPEDEPLMVRFHSTLSEQSVYLRYFAPISLSQRIAHERLTRMCFIDYDRAMALVAEHRDLTTGERAILAVGRLVKLHGTRDAEFALLVGDEFQGQGLGSELLRRLIDVGRKERLNRIIGELLPDNRMMHRVCETLGFRFTRSTGGPVRAELDL